MDVKVGKSMIACFTSMLLLSFLNGPFATNDHIVQNPPCWRASSLLFPHLDMKIKAS